MANSLGIRDSYEEVSEVDNSSLVHPALYILVREAQKKFFFSGPTTKAFTPHPPSA